MIQTAVRPWNTTARSSKSYARPTPHPVATGVIGVRTGGACRSVDPEIFFPNTRSDKETPGETRAKAICLECPVLLACRKWVMANPELTEFGVWSGLTEYERRVLREGSRVLA